MIREFNNKAPRIAASAFISEAAYVVGDVEIGENASVWPGAVIRADFGKVVIGANTSVEDNCVVHGASDVIIGHDVIVGHGAVVHCSVVGNHVLIGINAAVLDGAHIGDFSIIAAGSLVKTGAKIPTHSLASGSPAIIKGPLSPHQITRLKNGAALYVSLAQKYKNSGL